LRSDRTIPIHKPEIIIRKNENGTCMLIDDAISGHTNVIMKEIERLLKYADFTLRRNTVYAECKSKVIPIIIITGTIGNIYKSFR
jgi:hypothetical protein